MARDIPQKQNCRCKDAENEIVLLSGPRPNSKESVRQWSINPKRNSALKDNTQIHKNLHDFWYPDKLWPIDIWFVDYLRHQFTNYDEVIDKWEKCRPKNRDMRDKIDKWEKCKSQIRIRCLIKIEQQFPCFKNECNLQKNIERKRKKEGNVLKEKYISCIRAKCHKM